MPPSGGVVRVLEGTYNCSSPIIIEKSNVLLKGEGTGSSVIRLADHVHAPLFIIGSPETVEGKDGKFITPFRVHNVSVEGLTFDGNKKNHDPKKECGEFPCGTSATSIRNNSITIRGASNVHLNNIESHDSISGGLVTEKNSDHLRIENFHSHHNFFDGYGGYETTMSQFVNVSLHDNNAAGISVDIRFNDNHFIGGSIENKKCVGIYARDSKRNLFEKMRVSGNKNYGAYLSTPETGDPQCAEDNTFRDVEFTNSAKMGVVASAPCKRNRITGFSRIGGNPGRNVEGQIVVEKSVLVIPFDHQAEPQEKSSKSLLVH